jgi:hypothetical protein
MRNWLIEVLGLGRLGLETRLPVENEEPNVFREKVQG